MATTQLTLEGRKFKLGEIEIIKCSGCEKKIVRNKGSPAFENEREKYF